MGVLANQGGLTLASAIADLLTILDLEPLEVNIFRGRSPQQGWQRANAFNCLSDFTGVRDGLGSLVAATADGDETA